MESYDKKEIKSIANALKPQFNVGKSAITDTFIDTVDNYLRAHEIVKIKSLIAKDKGELKKMAAFLAEETDSEVVDVKGFTFVLFRKD
ncbi:MAG: YhbY family RNA-binding protein [Candidatus Woesearchaeota archaeon]|nr:YhbY family RNA-binding protein [Candidatus Woesearchaeota archaeon]